MGDLKKKSCSKFFGAFIIISLMLSVILTGSALNQFESGEPILMTNILPAGNDDLGMPALVDNDNTRAAAGISRDRNVDNNNWTMLLGNNLNHGYSTATAPKINNTLWTYNLKDKSGNAIVVYSSPVVTGDQVIIGAEDHNIYSFDKLTGEMNWNITTDGLVVPNSDPIESTPTVVNGKIYVGSDDRYLYCFNLDDGSLEWYFETAGPIKASPKVANNTVVVGCYDNPPTRARVYAVNASNGNEVWNFSATVEGDFQSTPAIDDDVVYIGFQISDPQANSSTIYAFDLGTGAELWSNKTSNGIYSSITVVNNKLLCGDLDGNIYAYMKTTGDLDWSYSTGDQIFSSPAVDIANNVMYIGSNDGDLYAMNIANGDKYWSYPVQTGSTKFKIKSTPIVVDEKLIFGANDGYVYCLKATTDSMIPPLRLLWRFDTDGSADSTAAPTEGIIYTASESGMIIAFANADVAADVGSMVVSEYAPYVGETIEISGKVFNNGSLKLNATVNFYFHLSFTFGHGAPEKRLISAHNITLDVDDELVINTSATIFDRDWSVVTNTFILLEIENVSYPEKKSKLSNNLDIESIEVLEYYEQDWLSHQRNNYNSGFGDAGSGTNKSIWKYDTGQISPGSIISSPLHGKGRLFVGSTNGMLYSILDDEGNLDWEFDAGGEIQGTPAILMNIEGSKQYEKIVFGTDSAKVYALNTNRGDLNWSFNTGGESVKGSPLISHGVVYIGTMSGTLIALDEDGFHDGDQGFDDSNEAKTRGDLLWNLTLTDPIRSAPVIMDDTIVLVTTKTDSSKIIAMDRESQSIQWSYEFDSSTLGSPIINPESGQVYLGTNDNFMYALDIQGLANGNQGLDTEDLAKSVNADIIWKFDSKGKITTTGAIDTEDDRLVFCTEDGYVYALPIDNFNEEESWKFHINGKISASPTIAMDYVYVGSENGILYCLSEFRGDFSSKNTSLLWTFDAGSAVLAPPIVDNFATYVATRDGIIHKLGAPNQPPSAIIDLPYINQTFFVEDHITLDASSSFDLEDRTNLKYIWYFSTAKDPPEFKVLYNYTSNSLVSVEINDTIKLAGDYIINLTVIDSYDSFAFNTTKITIYDPVIRIYNNQSIPSSCRIYFSGNGGIDLYATSDPNYISGNDQSGSVGDIDQFVNLFYSTFKPLYKVGWYNVSVGYKSDDLPEGYNVSRVRMYNYNQNTGSWNKQTNTGIDLDDRLVWANLTGDKITPMNEQLFAPGTFDNSPPTLNIIDNGVKPLNGSKDIEFEYLFEYTDENNDLPITANGGYVKIEINGWKYSMKETNKNDTDVTDGKYFNFSIKGKKLDPVSNNFRIYIHDGTYLVKSSLRQGPSVAFGKPPTARAGDDKTVTVGEHFELDASGSTDPDGNSNIELYLWDTNNDGDFNESGGSKQGMVTTWVFDEVGVYTITLLVLDKEGNPDTDTITITVNPKEKDDETKEDNSYLMLIGAVLVLIIIILLIIILIFMRKKEQSERERKAFVIDEEEEEEELEEDEGEEDEDLEDEDEESEDEDVEEGEEEEEGEKDEMDDEESEDEEDEELEGEEEDEEDLEVDEEFEEDFEEEFEEEPPEMESDELEEELDEPVESEVEPKELELEPETEEPVSEEEPIAEGSDQKEPAEEDTESKANEHEKKHMDKEIKTKKKMKTKSIKKSLKSKGLKKIKKKK